MGHAANEGMGAGDQHWQPDMGTGAYPVLNGSGHRAEWEAVSRAVFQATAVAARAVQERPRPLTESSKWPPWAAWKVFLTSAGKRDSSQPGVRARHRAALGYRLPQSPTAVNDTHINPYTGELDLRVTPVNPDRELSIPASCTRRNINSSSLCLLNRQIRYLFKEGRWNFDQVIKDIEVSDILKSPKDKDSRSSRLILLEKLNNMITPAGLDACVLYPGCFSQLRNVNLIGLHPGGSRRFQ